MDQDRDLDIPGDLSALAWVQDELRRTLDNAHKALRRHLRTLEAQPDADAGAMSPAALMQARNLVHQGVGALELIGLSAPARLLLGSEMALQQLSTGALALDLTAVTTIEKASFALLDYLRRSLAGHQLSPLSLFPQYRAVMTLAGAVRIHPADLWEAPVALPGLAAAAAAAGTPDVPDTRIRQAIESQLLKFFRNGDSAAARHLSDQFNALALRQADSGAGSWPLAAAFFEAQAAGLLPTDVYAKRMASRLLAQLRAAERGLTEPSDRMLQDLLFFCGRARRDEQRAPRLAAVARLHELPVAEEPVDYEQSSLGRYDPALIPTAKRRVAILKETWSAVAAGDLAPLPGVTEQAALVADSVQQLYPDGQRLARSLLNALDGAVRHAETPRAELAMEVATTLLCLDASLDELDPDQPELQQRVQRLAERLDTVSAGRPAAALEPWVEALYRDVSDRLSMGSVVQELRASLGEIEQQLDRYNRAPDEPAALIPVPGQLSSMRGVLSVLGLDQAAQAVQRMRDDLNRVLDQGADWDALREQMADNVGALSFMVDMLGVQPQLAKSLFRYEPHSGRFAALMGRTGPAARPATEPALVEQAQNLARGFQDTAMPDDELSSSLAGLADQAAAADEPGLARAAAGALGDFEQAQGEAEREAARAQVVQTLANYASTGPMAFHSVGTPQPAAAEPETEDMREVFIEEAREVLLHAGQALARLDLDPQDLEALTSLRRSFHTLKGSSRMVDLPTFGEAAWACEQLLNARLADAVVEAQTPLRNFIGTALAELGQWVEQIEAGHGSDQTGQGLIAAAQALRLAATPAWTVEATAPVAALPVDLDLEWAEGDGSAEALADPVAEAEAETEAETETEAVADLGADVAADVDPNRPSALPDVFELPVADIIPNWQDLPYQPVPQSDALAVFEAASDDERRDGLAGQQPASGWPAVDLGDPPAIGSDAAEAEAEAAGLVAAEVALQADLPDAPTPAIDPLPSAESLQAAEPLPQTGSEWPETTHHSTLEPEAGAVDLELELDLAALADSADAAAADVADSADVAGAVADDVDAASALAIAASPPMPTHGDDAERYKIVGPLRIQIALFNIFLNEADEQSRRLCVELQEWQLELQRPVGDLAVALAHSLAGNSATVGYVDLSNLARRLEHALERSCSRGGGQPAEAQLYLDVADEIRRLLHQFAAGLLKAVPQELLDRLHRHELAEAGMEDHYPQPDFDDAPVTMMTPLNPLGAVRYSALETELEADLMPAVAPARGGRAAAEFGADLGGLGEELDAADAIDQELFDIFIEEGRELLPALSEQLREWEQDPADLGAGVAAMRALHTFKGGARLAGAMRLGELAHRLETAIEQLTVRGAANAAVLSQLHAGADVLADEFERLAGGLPVDASAEAGKPLPALDAEDRLYPLDGALATRPMPLPLPLPVSIPASPAEEASADADHGLAATTAPAGDELPPAAIDWSRLAGGRPKGADLASAADTAVAGSVRVRAPLLDRMVSHAGEVGIARARMESDMGQMQGSLRELTDNLERLRRQLRDLELQAETQMSSRLEAARSLQQAFDPLEMDRFTRVQELTRMMAESVSDVGTVQRGLQQTLQNTEDQLSVQARLTRDLQDDLLRARMVEFDTLSDRLYRVVRQAAKESGKQVRLNLIGGGIELDRAVLDRMAPPFEHLLRNAVVHGIEPSDLRVSLGKPAAGNIEVSLRQSGNEVQIDVRDDGAGLDLPRIADRALRLGLLGPDSRPTESELAGLIFTPGFSTVDQVTELAGRGIGMDVVRSEVTAMGGRIETASSSGQGTAFRMVLPLTTAVTQVVLLRFDGLQVAVPSTLVELVRRVPAAEAEAAYASGVIRHNEVDLPFFWLGSLLQQSLRGAVDARTVPVVVVRSASQLVAVHVSEVVGNQEVVVKNLGPQLARLPGLAGMSLLASGGMVLIYNPVALSAVYGDEVRRRLLATPASGPTDEPADKPAHPVDEPVRKAPLVMVVDDSLTVRRVTQRLLLREGYRVVLAKDGLDALERLADETPAVMLCDIEMPRMDGFDLVNNLRSDPRLAGLPVVMITSRIADKHREHARALGVDHYLGKPYDEEQLLELVKSYAGEAALT